MGVVVLDICLQQPICDDVMLICINVLTFIYSYKTLFLLNFSAQICVLKYQNSLAPGEGASPLLIPLPLDAFGVSILGAYGASNFWPPHFQNRAAALASRSIKLVYLISSKNLILRH